MGMRRAGTAGNSITLLAAGLVLGAFLGRRAAADSAAREPVRVLAAASLADAFGEIASDFEKDSAGAVVELSFAGSQLLRTQIEQGAAADVFASADVVSADALKQSGHLRSYVVFTRNALTLVT